MSNEITPPLIREKSRGHLPDDFPKGPAIILVDPQMGDNIGTTARAMLNCGLTDLRIVRPRDGWPNERALATSSGAYMVLENAQVFDTTEDALHDIHYVLATTARDRSMNKEIFSPKTAAEKFHSLSDSTQNSAIFFGCERSGLINEDVVLADGIITVPLNPEFSSLNLAQAVLLICYQWFALADHDIAKEKENTDDQASKETLLNLFDHLETELENGNFFKTPEQKPTMIRNLRNMLGRAHLSPQEVQTLHGMIVNLTGRKR